MCKEIYCSAFRLWSWIALALYCTSRLDLRVPQLRAHARNPPGSGTVCREQCAPRFVVPEVAGVQYVARRSGDALCLVPWSSPRDVPSVKTATPSPSNRAGIAV